MSTMRALVGAIADDIPHGFYKNVSWQSITSIWSLGIGFLSTLFMARYLGATAYGLVAASTAVATFVFGIVELRLHEAVIRFVAEFWERDDKPKVVAAVKLSLYVDFCTGVLAYIIVTAVAILFGTRFVKDPRALTAILLCGGSVFFANIGTATVTGLLRVLGDFKVFAMVRIAGTTLNFVLVFTVLLSGGGVVAAMVATLVGSICTNSALIAAALFRLNRRISLRRTYAPVTLLSPRFREMAGFVGKLYCVSLTAIPTKDFDVNVLTWFVPLPAVGIYKIAKNFLLAMWVVADPAFIVIFPEISKMWTREEYPRLRAFIRRIALVLGTCGFAIVTVAFFAIPKLIDITVGARFYESGIVFRCMIWAVLFWFPLMWVNPLLMAADRVDLTLRATVLGAVTAITLFFVLIPLFGARGAALAYAMATPVTLLTALWNARNAGLLSAQTPVRAQSCVESA